MSSRLNMEDALNAVRAGTYSSGQAAREFNVPETTLRGLLKKLKIVPSKVCFYGFFLYTILY